MSEIKAKIEEAVDKLVQEEYGEDSPYQTLLTREMILPNTFDINHRNVADGTMTPEVAEQMLKADKIALLEPVEGSGGAVILTPRAAEMNDLPSIRTNGLLIYVDGELQSLDPAELGSLVMEYAE